MSRSTSKSLFTRNTHLLCLTLLSLIHSAVSLADTRVLIVAGLGGTDAYQRQFQEQVDALADASASVVNSRDSVQVLAGDSATKPAIQTQLNTLASNADSTDETLLFFVGHGTFDGQTYKFNIPGPDVSGNELAEWINAIPGKQLVAAFTSSSGALLETLADPNRTLVTATKNGQEKNAPLFAQFWVEGLSNSRADINKDERLSVVELFDYAQSGVEAYYQENVLLAPEHARLQGTDTDQMYVARIGMLREVGQNDESSALLSERTRIEMEIQTLMGQRNTLDEDAYFQQLQPLMIELGALQAQLDALAEGDSQ